MRQYLAGELEIELHPQGTLAERIKLWPFLIFVAVLTGVIYPIQGSWEWGNGWLDDMGFSDIGCYGGEVDTPHLDRLAAEGMRFTQFYCGAPVCAPSRCVLLTGKHIGHASVRGNQGGLILDEEVTIA